MERVSLDQVQNDLKAIHVQRHCTDTGNADAIAARLRTKHSIRIVWPYAPSEVAHTTNDVRFIVRRQRVMWDAGTRAALDTDTSLRT